MVIARVRVHDCNCYDEYIHMHRQANGVLMPSHTNRPNVDYLCMFVLVYTNCCYFALFIYADALCLKKTSRCLSSSCSFTSPTSKCYNPNHVPYIHRTVKHRFIQNKNSMLVLAGISFPLIISHSTAYSIVTISSATAKVASVLLFTSSTVTPGASSVSVKVPFSRSTWKTHYHAKY